MQGTETQKKTTGQFNNCCPNLRTCIQSMALCSLSHIGSKYHLASYPVGNSASFSQNNSGYSTKLTTPFRLCSSRINALYMSSQQVVKNRNNSETTLSKEIFPVARQCAISWMYVDQLLLISLPWNTANSLCATEMSGAACKPATTVLRSEVLKCARSSTHKS